MGCLCFISALLSWLSLTGWPRFTPTSPTLTTSISVLMKRSAHGKHFSGMYRSMLQRPSLVDMCALSSDPWWIYTTCNLFWVIKKHYKFGLIELMRECPRFGLMLGSMCLSILFSVADVLSVTGVLSTAMPTGINPFWKVSLHCVTASRCSHPGLTNGALQLCFMFKCLCDTIILDDFKSALDKLSTRWLARNGMLEIHTIGQLFPLSSSLTALSSASGV